MVETPLIDKKDETVKKPEYSPKEELYLKGLRTRLESARNQRDQGHTEFDGMDYSMYFEMCERLANTYTSPKKNKEDTNYQSGTVRQKLLVTLSSINNLNLSGDISAYEKNGLEVQGLGDAMEDVILKTNELDNDEEKKYMRQYELLKHGTVFVEELWDERNKKVKKKVKWNGKVTGMEEWNERIKKAFARPSRNIIPGINVYLGDITKYDLTEQPFIFTVDAKHYDEAKTIFGEWERWDNVPKKIVQSDATMSATQYSNPNWRLLETRENYVEIIRYQDKWNNEFAVLLNGVLMTPMGLPLPWGYEEYNIAQQNLEPIHGKFAYGKSFVFRIRNKVAILDEFMKLAVLKTQKSFMPPYLNISGRILSNKVFMPGKISHGIAPNSLQPISQNEAEGIKTSELAMIKEIQDSINNDTVSPTFAGQHTSGNPTATEIIELQRQAKMVMGLTVFSASMLEWKLEWLRLKNILANWFKEEDKVVDAARGVLKSRYRTVSVERNIEGEGIGRRMVIPTKEIPSVSSIRKAEDMLSKEQGMPIRMTFVNPEEICSSKLVWYITVRPKEKRTSETDKLMFRAFLEDIIPLGPDPSYVRERAATVWGEDPRKLFPARTNPMGEVNGGAANPQQSATLSPRINLPTAESAANRQVKTALGTSV